MGNAMIETVKRGVKVEGVFETVGSDSEFNWLPVLCGRRPWRDNLQASCITRSSS